VVAARHEKRLRRAKRSDPAGIGPVGRAWGITITCREYDHVSRRAPIPLSGNSISVIAGPRIDMSPYPGVSGGIALGIPYIARYMVGLSL